MGASSFNHQIFHFKSPPYQDNPFFLPHPDPCANIRFLFPQTWLSENQKGGSGGEQEGEVIAIAYWTEEHTGAQNIKKASLGLTADGQRLESASTQSCHPIQLRDSTDSL